MQRGYTPPNGWVLHWVRSKTRTPGLSPSQIKEIQQLAADREGAHVLAYSRHGVPERQQVQERFLPFFRFRWLNSSTLSLIPHSMTDFFQTVEAALSEELLWDSLVKPRDILGPLLLPRCTFIARDEYSKVWDRALDYGADHRIESAARAIEAFTETYRLSIRGRGRRWVDGEGRVFDHSGPRHAQHAPFPYSWKYAFGIPLGFHYDVSSSQGRAISVRDHLGMVRTSTYGGHLNVDAHGVVR